MELKNKEMFLWAKEVHVGIPLEVFCYDDPYETTCNQKLCIHLGNHNYTKNDELNTVAEILRYKGCPVFVSFPGCVKMEDGNMYIVFRGRGQLAIMPDEFIHASFFVNGGEYTLLCPKNFNPYATTREKDRYLRNCTEQLLKSIISMENCRHLMPPCITR